MEVLQQELLSGLPDATQVVQITVRLVIAALLGAVIGIQRERAGKPAGIRTHMLVSLGAALFIIAPEESGMVPGDLARIIQGLAAGIGFIGGGAILKLTDERDVLGLTTAAGIWMTAAVGISVGLGRWGAAILAVLLTWVILSVVGRYEHHRHGRPDRPSE